MKLDLLAKLRLPLHLRPRLGPHLHLRPKAIAAMALAVGLATTGLAAVWQVRDNAATAALRFDVRVAKAVNQVADRLRPYEYAVLSARGAVVAAGTRQLDRALYRRYSQSVDLEREFPGARGIGVIRRVAAADEAAFVAAARRDGRPDFAIHQLAPHDGERYVVQYVEPAETNTRGTGVDIASEPRRRAAARLAMDSGGAVLSQPITLRESQSGQSSFLLLLPIYEPNRPLTTPQAREAATFGWTFVRLTIDDVLKGFDFDGGEFTLALRDRNEAETVNFFASSGSQSPAAEGLARRVAIPIYGRVWEADVRAQPRFFEALNQRDPKALVGGGVLLSVLIAAFLYALARGTLRALQLRNEQALRAAIVDSANDAIVGASLDGIVIDWNRAAECLFGYTAKAAVGRSVATLLLPPGCEHEDEQLRARVGRGVAVPPFDAVRLAADGTLIDVSIAASPVYAADGRIVGLAATLRDVRPAKAAERRVLEHNALLAEQVAERTTSLESARRDLQTILDAVPSLIGYWDKNLLNRFGNQAYRKWFGMEPEVLRGRHMRTLLSDAVFERCQPHIEAALRGESTSFENAMPIPGEQGVRHMLAHYVPDKLGGEVRGFYVLVHDITEQMNDKARLAAALRENEALLSTIRMHAIVSVVDHRARIVDVNDAFCRSSGYTRDELLGQNHGILNSGVHEDQFWASMWLTITHGEPWRGEICNRAKDGSLYWTDSMISPIAGEDGQIEKYMSIRFDVTAAKRAEQSLRDSEALLDRAGRAAGVGCWEMDLRTQAITWSEHTYRIHEVEPGYQPRLDVALDFYPTGSRELIERAVAGSMSGGGGWDLELPFITAKGRAIWVRAVGVVEFEQGQPVRVVGAFQDVTERKHTEIQLQQTNERFSLACEAAGIGVWEWDIVANTLVWDERMYCLYQRRPGEGIEPYTLWADNLHPLDRVRTEAEIQRGVSGEQMFDTEFRILWPDGEVRHLKTAGRVQWDAAGTALRMTGVNFDITERKRAELELRETSSLLGSVLDAASEVSIIATAPDFTIKVFNRGAELLLGYDASELVGLATPSLIHDAAELDSRAAELSAELGRSVSVATVLTEASTLRRPHVWTYRRKDGRRISVSLVVTAICGSAGEVLGYLGVAHDVTLQKQLETSLRDASREAEQASQAKSRFLACMSHEIRTPMNAVMGLAYLLARTPLNDEQAGFLRMIERAGKSLLSMINDSLDIAKIEAGELHVACETFCLRELLERLADMSRVQSNAGCIGFDLDLPLALPPWLAGDAARLNQVLTNLTSNAIKFTQHGGVRLVVRLLPAAPGAKPEQSTLRFEVHDTGIGISAEDASHLFRPFSQADTSITRRFGGTGLGLSIAKQLTELMGGRIGLRSTPGVGSEFWVELEFTHSRPPTGLLAPDMIRPVNGQRGLENVRVLVVDDSDINLEVARRMLALEGALVHLATNGLEAMDCLRSRPRDFDAVLMDVQMPVLDGLEATRRIRSELGLHALPVIGLTAGGLNSQREQAAQAGMNDFMVKPFEPQDLVACIRRHVVRSVAINPTLGMAALPATAAPWPEIDGITTRDVATRLGGDQALFRSMLSQLLAEFASSVAFAHSDDGAWLRLAPALHKLGGSAANLGAKAIAALAAEGERACAQGDRVRVQQLAKGLAEQLQALQQSAAEWLSEGPTDTAVSAADAAEPLSAEALANLMTLLHQQQASAVAQFELLACSLRQRLGSERFALVRDHVDMLRFRDAERELALELPLGSQPARLLAMAATPV